MMRSKNKDKEEDTWRNGIDYLCVYIHGTMLTLIHKNNNNNNNDNIVRCGIMTKSTKKSGQ